MIKLRSIVMCFVAVILVGSFLTGCSPSKKSEKEETAADDRLVGDWYLTSLLENGTEVAVPGVNGITLSVNAGSDGSYEAHGFSGVNNYSGPISVSGNDYVGGPFAVTMVAGTPENEDFERLYLETLGLGDALVIAADGHGMEIAKSSGETALLFDRFKFDGSRWVLTAYYNGTGVESIDPSKVAPTLDFGTKSDINSFSGSDYVVGSYSVDYKGRTISFVDIAPIAGIEGGIQGTDTTLSQTYLDLLQKASGYVLSGNTFQLIDKDGTTLLVFTAK